MGPTDGIRISMSQTRIEMLSEALKVTLAILRDYAPINDQAIAIQVEQAKSILGEFGCTRTSSKTPQH